MTVQPFVFYVSIKIHMLLVIVIIKLQNPHCPHVNLSICLTCLYQCFKCRNVYWQVDVHSIRNFVHHTAAPLANDAFVQIWHGKVMLINSYISLEMALRILKCSWNSGLLTAVDLKKTWALWNSIVLEIQLKCFCSWYEAVFESLFNS